MHPTNKKLYDKVVEEAKQKFRVWPSAYASGWVVRRYKELGGTYKDEKNTTTPPLARWYKQEWINVCELPTIVPCGRSKSDWKDYPYCRPLKRITKETPTTAGELSKGQIQKRCAKKKSNPKEKIIVIKKET